MEIPTQKLHLVRAGMDITYVTRARTIGLADGTCRAPLVVIGQPQQLKLRHRGVPTQKERVRADGIHRHETRLESLGGVLDPPAAAQGTPHSGASASHGRIEQKPTVLNFVGIAWEMGNVQCWLVAL